jgi:glycosyltransferase involved in cell wall biosynthesis
MERKVSVIIPSYNRFKSLLNAIQSIKQQTYTNIEIIVVNDGSSEKEYYEWDAEGVRLIHLEINSREKYNECTLESCIGFVRNAGIDVAQGYYIAFCDDDDIWFPKKLQLQIEAMKETGCQMSSTDGYIGCGEYDKNQNYQKYNGECFYDAIRNIHRRKGSRLMENGYPRIWTLNFLLVHNAMITSSVVIKKQVLGQFMNVKYIAEDYDCWLRALQKTDSVYVDDVCFYYSN